MRGFISWIIPCYRSPKYVVAGGINWIDVVRNQSERLEKLDTEECKEGLTRVQKGRVSRSANFSVDKGNNCQRL